MRNPDICQAVFSDRHPEVSNTLRREYIQVWKGGHSMVSSTGMQKQQPINAGKRQIRRLSDVSPEP
jgi:hypothetical protein